MGIRCDVLPLENEFALFVHARDSDRAQKQLELYLHENRVAGIASEPSVTPGYCLLFLRAIPRPLQGT